MSGASSYLETATLNWLKGTAMPAAPTTLYMGLFSSDPTDAATGGTEVTSAIRTAGRVAVVLGAVTNSAVSNSQVIDFGQSQSAAQVNVTHFAIFDALTGGNKLISNALNSAKPVTQGDPVSFAVGSLNLRDD